MTTRPHLTVRLTLMHSAIGVTAASTILGLWALSLLVLLTQPLPVWAWPAGVALQTFLYTGLFITAHDSMHGTVFPASSTINDAFGRLAATLYALFSFTSMREEHWKHHDHVATEDDPDFHDAEHPHPVRWYFHFMFHYMTVWQLVGMAIVFNVLSYGVGVPELRLLVFWVAPALLSTVQLFFFGTYLPHRRPESGYDDDNRARSNDFSPWLSFLTCYHFGYHWEHHEYPHAPWWMLPQVRRAQLEADARRSVGGGTHEAMT
ncbi:MAG: fatty acid desaturase [Myxococcota bacterium]